MKFTLFVILFSSLNLYSQDTLYHDVIGLGQEKLTLKSDGSFLFESSLCGKYSISLGTYNETLFGIKLSYDTTMCPKVSLVELNEEDATDSITFYFFDMIDSSKTITYDQLIIGGHSFNCDTNFLKISRINLKNDTLIYRSANDLHVFKLNESNSKYHLYVEPLALYYSCGNYFTDKLRKVRNGYVYKKIVFDEIKDKPWKKGKRRKVKLYFIKGKSPIK